MTDDKVRELFQEALGDRYEVKVSDAPWVSPGGYATQLELEAAIATKRREGMHYVFVTYSGRPGQFVELPITRLMTKRLRPAVLKHAVATWSKQVAAKFGELHES